MPDDNKKQTAEETRPVPSQAEGDEETIEKALEQQSKKEKQK